MAATGKPFPQYVNERAAADLENNPRFIAAEGAAGVGADYDAIKADLGLDFAPASLEGEVDALAVEVDGKAPLVDSIFLGVHDLSAVVGASLAQATINSRQRCWSMAANENAYLQWEGFVPSHWVTFTVDIHYVNLTTGTGNIRLYCDYLHLAPGDSTDTNAIASVQAVVAAGTRYIETLRRALVTTVPLVEAFPAPTPPDRLMLSVRRQGADASDTLEAAIGIKGLTLTKLS